MRKKLFSTSLTFLILLAVLVVVPASAATTPGSLSFTNTPLLRPEGASEPAIAIASNGTMAISGLVWTLFATHLWVGPFGSTPAYQGLVDAGLQQPGRLVLAGEDADVDIGASGTLHATALILLANSTFQGFQLGVSAITCPGVTSANFNLSGCTKQIIDTTQADRQWITSEGMHVYISYHDSGSSTLIHVQRSDDDGYTWKKVASPIVGQDGITANATFNNIQGPLVADPVTHNVYAIYAAGETGLLKGTTFLPNNIYVSRSVDMGKSWTANLVYHATPGTNFANVFPSLAVDPLNGKLYAVFSDGVHVFFSTSSDQGASWSAAVQVNTSPAPTAIFPWVAAYNGKVDVVYYATTASSKNDTSAVWNVYLAQTLNGGTSFTQSLVSNAPNHVGVICTQGIACASGTRNLLDLFEVSINPQNGRAGIIYTDDTLTVDSLGNPLPQVVLAQEKP